MSSTRRSIVGEIVVAVAAAVALAGTMLGVPGAAAAGVPAITVTPSTDLVSGETVTVEGTGFVPGSTGVLQCRTGVAGIGDCDLNTLRFVEAASDGTFSMPFTVHRRISLGTELLDCAQADACVIAAGNTIDQVTGSTHPVAFDPAAPGPDPQVSIEPATGLRNGQTVDVTGTGFLPNGYVGLTQCPATTPGCTVGVFFPVFVDPDGTFHTTFTVRTRVTQDGVTSSCIPDACVLHVRGNDAEYDLSVPLGFDPEQPPPADPALYVVPSTDLADHQEVGVLGTGFDPNQGIVIEQCETDSPYCPGSTYAFTNADGAFLMPVVVRRNIAIYGPDGITAQDCALTACVLRARDFQSGLEVAQPLGFDPAIPPAPAPTITVDPHDALEYRQQVSVHGTGFVPGEFVQIEQCAGDPNELATLGCRGFDDAVADSTGAIALDFVVQRTIRTYAPIGEAVADCADPVGSCYVSARGSNPLDRATVVVTFDPDAPVPPPPSVTVEPDDGLGWKQTVDVTGSGFDPGERLFLNQCRVDPAQPFGGPCAAYTAAQADDEGRLDTSATVRRILSDGYAPPVDCATAPGTCELRVQRATDDAPVTVPLAFDPDSQAPPPPTLTLTPGTGFEDGEVVELDAAGFAPGANLGFALCRAGATSVNNCDLSHVQYGTAGPDGTFHGSITLAATLSVGTEPVDCTAAPGTCVVGMANMSDFVENAQTPLTFGPTASVTGRRVVEKTGEDDIIGLRVELSRPSTREVRVHWATVDGRAVAPDDYVAASGDLVFAPGETEQVVPLGIIGDRRHEHREWFFVELSDPRGGGLDPAHTRAGVAIHDDDHRRHDHHRR